MAIMERPQRSPTGNSNGHSKPFMPNLMVSAPGKVIVYGEHAVVHGKAAIAAAISLRSYLLVTFLSKTDHVVTLRFPDIEFEHTWKIDDLPWSQFAAPEKKTHYYDLVTSLDADLLESLEPHTAGISPKAPAATRKIHQATATAFLYLFLSLGSKKVPGCVYTLRSTIPIGAGLGSSASISVCLACALLLQIRALSGPHVDQPHDESALQIERINRWAFVGELCIHGNPSGVDNTVASGGKAVMFQRKDYKRPPTVQTLNNFPELPLLLVNTRHSRSTAVEVAKVEKLRKDHPKITEHILEAINVVTQSVYKLLTREYDDVDYDDPAVIEQIGRLMAINHGLLVSLGVSHPKLERIRALVDHTGIGWTKLTGAGGGGCAITILKSSEAPHGPKDPQSPSGKRAKTNGSGVNGVDDKRERLQKLEKQLEGEGFEIYETTLGGEGVGVLWPAVLHNGSGEEGGEEIDEEKFLNAEGNAGVERLVGVHAVGIASLNGADEADSGARDGWKFWRT